MRLVTRTSRLGFFNFALHKCPVSSAPVTLFWLHSAFHLDMTHVTNLWFLCWYKESSLIENVYIQNNCNKLEQSLICSIRQLEFEGRCDEFMEILQA